MPENAEQKRFFTIIEAVDYLKSIGVIASKGFLRWGAVEDAERQVDFG
jgi:hypothetical protein